VDAGRAADPADVQDRDGACELLRTARRSFPFIETIFADAGYQGPKMAAAVAATGCWTLEIVKRTDAHRFVILPKRWIVERTFAWISRNRRLARDFERYARTVIAFWTRFWGSGHFCPSQSQNHPDRPPGEFSTLPRHTLAPTPSPGRCSCRQP